MAKRPPYSIIRGGKLLDAARRRATAADILVKGDTIAAIGRPGMSAPAGATIIDAKHRLMHPGLINAHMHTWQTGLRGYAADWTLLEYFRNATGITAEPPECATT